MASQTEQKAVQNINISVFTIGSADEDYRDNGDDMSIASDLTDGFGEVPLTGGDLSALIAKLQNAQEQGQGVYFRAVIEEEA